MAHKLVKTVDNWNCSTKTNMLDYKNMTAETEGDVIVDWYTTTA